MDMNKMMRGWLAAMLVFVVALAVGCPSPGGGENLGDLLSDSGDLDAAPAAPAAPDASDVPATSGKGSIRFANSTNSTQLVNAASPRASQAAPPEVPSAPKQPSIIESGPVAQVAQAPSTTKTDTGEAGLGKASAKSKQPLFEGWKKPRLAIAITGQQHGYIEPCGCTGLANQKGGMMRRHTLFKNLKAQGWPLLPLDVGGQVRRTGPQAESKYKWTCEALFELGYKAVGYGVDDVVLSSGELAFPMLNSEESPYPFVCSNVSVISTTPTHRILTIDDLKVGITAVLGDDELKQLVNENPGVETRSVDEGLKDAWSKLAAAECNFYVLLAHASVEETRKIAKRHPHFHLVVTTGLGEPERIPERIEVAPKKVSLMVQSGNKAMYVGVIGLYDTAPRVRYERVPLDDRFKDSPEMVQIMKAYQAELKEQGLKRLGAVEVPHYSGEKFVGADACKDCHSKAYAHWKKTPHAHATDSIVRPAERADVERHFDPECLSCHVTGWAPQEYTPYETGFLGLEATPHLQHNGCENCHGPGQRHVDIENGDLEVTEAVQAEVRKKMQLPKARAKEHCVMCHDQDNSPDFFKPGAFEKYYKAIEHHGKD